MITTTIMITANGHAHAHDEEEHVMIGTKAVTRDILDGIADKDLVAVQAWFSMDLWYRPAVATWTREPAVLREMQQSPSLRAALRALGSVTETSHWLSLLIETVFESPFLFLFPETKEAYRLTIDGVSDMGQLSALVAPALREPLERIGITDQPDEEILAVMRGDGPQQGEGTYSCGFHCYQSRRRIQRAACRATTSPCGARPAAPARIACRPISCPAP